MQIYIELHSIYNILLYKIYIELELYRKLYTIFKVLYANILLQ